MVGRSILRPERSSGAVNAWAGREGPVGQAPCVYRPAEGFRGEVSPAAGDGPGASQSRGWTGAAVGSLDRRQGRPARLPYRLAVIVSSAGSADSGRWSGGSRWLSAPAPKAAGAACRRPGYRPAPRGARCLDPNKRKSAMKPFGFRPRMPHAFAARDSNPEPLRLSVDRLRSGGSAS